MVELAAGQNVYMQGDTGSRFYIIKEGSVTCTKTTDPTKPPAVFTLNAGQFFGERALLKDEVRQVLRPGLHHQHPDDGRCCSVLSSFPWYSYWFLTLLQVCCKPGDLDGYSRHSQLSFEADSTHAGLGGIVYWVLAWIC